MALIIADLQQYGWELTVIAPGSQSADAQPLEEAAHAQPEDEPEMAAEAQPEDALETKVETQPREAPETSAYAQLETQLAQKINELIQRDFGALVQLLYRVDVSEQRLRRLLDERNDEDAGVLIARLIIERQWQKIESRRRYRRDDDADVGVDRW